MTELNNPVNIYTKLKNIQGKNTEILKDNLNKFQNYKYFTEYQALTFLKPLLAEQNLSLHFEDLPELETKIELKDKNWVIWYWKQATLINGDNPAERISSKFLSLGSNQDIAKAKGVAETYATKYFLTKFFLIPVADSLDPDKEQWTSQQNKLAEAEKKQVDDLFKRHGLEEDIKTSTATNKKISVGNYQPNYRFDLPFANLCEKHSKLVNDNSDLLKINEEAKRIIKPWPKLHFGKGGYGKIRFKSYLKDLPGVIPLTWWANDIYEDPKWELKNMVGYFLKELKLEKPKPKFICACPKNDDFPILKSSLGTDCLNCYPFLKKQNKKN